MPLLYGEGAEKAFIRLHMEITKDSNDESLFAWTSDQNYSGLLAERPSYFANSGAIAIPRYGPITRPPYFITNRGLEIALPKVHLQSLQTNIVVRFFLRCERWSNRENLPDGTMKALYVELLCGNGLGVREGCRTLEETNTYEVNHLDKALAKNERLYITNRSAYSDEIHHNFSFTFKECSGE